MCCLQPLCKVVKRSKQICQRVSTIDKQKGAVKEPHLQRSCNKPAQIVLASSCSHCISCLPDAYGSPSKLLLSLTCAGLHPLPYHAANVLLHASASILVLMLAKQLFSRLEQLRTREACAPAFDASIRSAKMAAAAAASATTGTTPGIEAAQALRRRRPLQAGTTGTSNGVTERCADASSAEAMEVDTEHLSRVQLQALLQAFIASLLFALHPIHTEVSAHCTWWCVISHTN